MGHEGLWYEQQDMWSKYLRRPMETIGEMCFAQFAKMYKSYSKVKSEKELDDDLKEGDEEVEDDGYQTDDPDEKFNYIITHNEKKGNKIPECITLKDPYPGESRMMIKRKFPAVLRFNKTNKDNNPRSCLAS